MLASDGICGNYVLENGIDDRDIEYADKVVPTVQRIRANTERYELTLWEKWEAVRAGLDHNKIVSALESRSVSPLSVAQAIVDAPLQRDETYLKRPVDDKSLILIKTQP
jgi:hypothetical protein